jgi:adenylate kinase
MIEIVQDRLSRPDAARGYILDGFPRTVPQAEALDGMVGTLPLAVINLAVPDEDLMQRMVGRRVCSKCGGECRSGCGGQRGLSPLRRRDDRTGR